MYVGEHTKCSIKMRSLKMFITAVCFIYTVLLKLRWPKNKTLHYKITFTIGGFAINHAVYPEEYN